MPELLIRCPHCGTEMHLPDTSLLGRRARCRGCRREFLLEGPPDPAGTGSASATAATSPPASARPAEAGERAVRVGAPGGGDAPSADGDALPEGHVRIRCPHCRTPLAVSTDAAMSDVTCGSCGSHFSLAATETVSARPDRVRTLGRFELIAEVGAGAFGTVYKARDRELRRTVAVKIPRRDRLEPAEVEKFVREARAAAQLRHPNIVGVHEVGREGDVVYIVSDFVEGITLADWLADQRPGGREAAELCAKIAAALHHAHEAGVVHRDLKPANIMIGADGEPHVMDFGLAKREAGEVTMTLEGRSSAPRRTCRPSRRAARGTTPTAARTSTRWG